MDPHNNPAFKELKQKLGEERMQEALADIGGAQRLLDKAASAPSPIVNGQQAWRRVIKTYDAVHATWESVKELAEKLRQTPGGLRVDDFNAQDVAEKVAQRAAEEERP